MHHTQLDNVAYSSHDEETNTNRLGDFEKLSSISCSHVHVSFRS